MKYAAEMGSGAEMYIPIHKDWFRHSEVNGGGGCTALRPDKPTLFFFSK
jgi:hypothetical protein